MHVTVSVVSDDVERISVRKDCILDEAEQTAKEILLDVMTICRWWLGV